MLVVNQTLADPSLIPSQLAELLGQLRSHNHSVVRWRHAERGFYLIFQVCIYNEVIGVSVAMFYMPKVKFQLNEVSLRSSQI